MQRLNVIVSGIVAFALLIFIAMTALWVSNSERNQLAQQTTTLAQQIASQAAGIEMGESQLQMMLSGLSPYESILHAHIYTISPDGETLSYLIGYHQQGRSPLPSQENQIDGSVQHVFTSDYIQVTVPIYQDRNLTGVVMLPFFVAWGKITVSTSFIVLARYLFGRDAQCDCRSAILYSQPRNEHSSLHTSHRLC